MADLESCYFCGEIDDVTEYAVVPPRLNPTVEEQQSVVLCPTCHGKLTEVMRPIVSRIEALEALAADRDAPADGVGSTGAGEAGSDADATGDGDAPEGDDDTARAAVGTGDEAEDGSAGVDEAPGPDAAGAPGLAPTGTDLPDGYRKVVRLLENRDLPIRRTEAEDLAASAYDLDPDRVAAIVDAAVQRGALGQDGPRLTPP